MQHTIRQQDNLLAAAGFRGGSTTTGRTQNVKTLQAVVGVAVDGIWGPLTSAAVTELSANGWRVAANFRLQEFQCRCGGKYRDCQGIRVTPALIVLVQTIRAKYYPKGLVLLSAYRCPGHNRAVGGASASQHMYGTAADMTGRLTIAEAKACGARGIGYGRHSARVNHVDTRAVPATFVDGL